MLHPLMLFLPLFLGAPELTPPTIKFVAPACSPATGGVAVTITGSGFTGATSAAFGGGFLSALAVINDSTITGILPAGSPGAADVVVCTPSGCTTLSEAFAFTPTTSVNIILGGGFELAPANVTISAGSTAVPNWTVVSDSIDVYGPFAGGGNGWQPAGGARSIDLSGNSPGVIEQTVATTSGAAYLVVFSIAANNNPPNPKQLEVSAAGQSAVFTFDGTGYDQATMGWRCKAWTFVANGPTTALRFTSQTPGASGAALDEIYVFPAVSISGPPAATIGTTIDYVLHTGAPFAIYWFEVSLTGSAPGVPIPGGLVIPLNEPWLNYTFGPAYPGFVDFVGLTDSAGEAATHVVLPSLSFLAGSTLTASFVVIDLGLPTFVSAVATPFTTLIQGPPPAITTVVPSAGPAAGGTVVTISGSDFQSGATVKFGNAHATGVTVTGGSITCTAPSGAVGPVDVTVVNTDGQTVAASSAFLFVANLQLTSVAPMIAAPGTSVLLSGAGFQSGMTVSVGGVPITLLSQSSSSATFAFPVGAPCGTTVAVTTPFGQSGSLPFNPSPTVSGTLFSSGTHNGGQPFFISGSNFVTGTAVTIGGAPASITTLTSSTIFVTTPAGSVGSATVLVTSPSGCTGTASYTYL